MLRAWCRGQQAADVPAVIPKPMPTPRLLVACSNMHCVDVLNIATTLIVMAFITLDYFLIDR